MSTDGMVMDGLSESVDGCLLAIKRCVIQPWCPDLKGGTNKFFGVATHFEHEFQICKLSSHKVGEDKPLQINKVDNYPSEKSNVVKFEFYSLKQPYDDVLVHTEFPLIGSQRHWE